MSEVVFPPPDELPPDDDFSLDDELPPDDDDFPLEELPPDDELPPDFLLVELDLLDELLEELLDELDEDEP